MPHSYRPWPDLAIAIRTAGDPTRLTKEARRAIRSVDQGQAIATVWTMDGAIRDSLADPVVTLRSD